MRIALRVIGIGPGGLRQITLEAIDAIRATDVFLFLDKGDRKESLLAVRRAMLEQYATPGHRVVELDDPPRDRQPADYDAEVRRWHAARAEVIESAVRENVSDGGSVGFLVWGDPALYDSTLRIVDDVRARQDESTADPLQLDIDVIAGVTSASALTAAHRILANRIGEPIVITTGRRLADTPSGIDGNQIVMLDGDLAFRATAGPDDHIWWGAYVGTDEEILISGRVADVADEIAAARADARERIGWIMDIYLLRRGMGR